jgi:hypothetical protein
MNEKERVVLGRMKKAGPVMLGAEEDFKKGEHFQLSPGDIVIASPTKSGTTLVQQVLIPSQPDPDCCGSRRAQAEQSRIEIVQYGT